MFPSSISAKKIADQVIFPDCPSACGMETHPDAKVQGLIKSKCMTIEGFVDHRASKKNCPAFEQPNKCINALNGGNGTKLLLLRMYFIEIAHKLYDGYGCYSPLWMVTKEEKKKREPTGSTTKLSLNHWCEAKLKYK